MLNRNEKFPKNWILCERVLKPTPPPFPRLVLSLLCDYSSTSAISIPVSLSTLALQPSQSPINLLPCTSQSSTYSHAPLSLLNPPSTYSHTPSSHQPTPMHLPAISIPYQPTPTTQSATTLLLHQS